jgi:hypothetical protein
MFCVNKYCKHTSQIKSLYHSQGHFKATVSPEDSMILSTPQFIKKIKRHRVLLYNNSDVFYMKSHYGELVSKFNVTLYNILLYVFIFIAIQTGN